MDFILMSIWLMPKNVKKNYQAKKSFIVPWPVKKIRVKEYEHILKVWDRFEMKTMKDYRNLYLKCDVSC